MKDGEFSFGTNSANFDELRKKYKPVSDDEGTPQAAPVNRFPEPEPSLEDTFEQELSNAFASLNLPAADEEDDEFEFDIDEYDDDDDDENQGDFTFDTTLAQAEIKSAQPEFDMSFKKEEPKFAYDLDMFGNTPKTSFDVNGVDDSWLDESLDDSIFYTPSPAMQQPTAANAELAQEQVPQYGDAAGEAGLEPQPEEAFTEQAPEDESFAEFIDDGVQPETPQPVVNTHAKLPAEPQPTQVAGGYIAQSNVGTFTFDPDSGMDFGDEQEPALPQELEGLPVFAPVTPDKKSNSKLKAKKERKAMTGFSKDYKVGGDEGKPVKKGNVFTRNFIPVKGDSAAEIIRKIVMVIAVLAIFGSAGYLFNDYVIMPYLNEKSIEELGNLIGESNEVIDKESMAEKYPGVDFPEGMLEKYAALYARNQDFVGWITIDELDISLPVVRGENNEQYLKTDFDGKKNKYGSIFMNCSNSVERLNYNTSLFGHHMKDNKMFGRLADYKTVNGYKKAPVIEFNTLYGDYKWKVFAVMITNGTSDGDDGYLFNYMFTDLSTDEAVDEFLGEVKLRSIYYPKVDIALSDKILTLSTCTYEMEEGRLVVMARMVRPGESTDVDVSAVRYNSNPRYPQGYYTKNKLTNPYKDYNKWYPS